jgi:hypothetical protein
MAAHCRRTQHYHEPDLGTRCTVYITSCGKLLIPQPAWTNGTGAEGAFSTLLRASAAREARTGFEKLALLGLAAQWGSQNGPCRASASQRSLLAGHVPAVAREA